jgi:uncharacterized protein YbjQ (UPF0145 family)
MKRRVVSVRLLPILLAVGFMCTGCVTSQIGHQNWGNFSDVVISTKDFETLGMVFTETEFQTNINNSISGDVFTYQALLKKAQELDADAIINVIIDRKTENSTTNLLFGSTSQKKETWYGSALAIKYTIPLTQNHQTVTAFSQQNLTGSSEPDSGTQSNAAPRRNSVWPWVLGALGGLVVGGFIGASL